MIYGVKLVTKGKTPIYMDMYNFELAKSMGELYDEAEIRNGETDELLWYFPNNDKIKITEGGI